MKVFIMAIILFIATTAAYPSGNEMYGSGNNEMYGTGSSDVNEADKATWNDAATWSDPNWANCRWLYAGEDLKTVYTWLASSDRDADLGDATNINRRTLLIPTGDFEISSAFTLTQYVDIVGIGSVDINNQTSTAMQIPTLTSAETGVTNYVRNVRIYGAGKGIATAAISTVRRVVVLDDVTISSDNDCIYEVGANRYVTYYLNNCTFNYTWDGVMLNATGVQGYLSNCRFNGTNTDNATGSTALIMKGSESYVMNCVFNLDSTLTSGNVTTRGITITAGETHIIGCDFLKVAAATSSGVAQADAIYLTGGTAHLNSNKIADVTTYDINNSGGTVYIEKGNTYSATKTYGTITVRDSTGGEICLAYAKDVNMTAGAAATTLFTSAADVNVIITRVVVSAPTASLADGTDYDFTNWEDFDLSSMTTANTDYMILTSTTKYTLLPPSTAFTITPSTGSTATAFAKVSVYGIVKN